MVLTVKPQFVAVADRLRACGRAAFTGTKSDGLSALLVVLPADENVIARARRVLKTRPRAENVPARVPRSETRLSYRIGSPTDERLRHQAADGATRLESDSDRPGVADRLCAAETTCRVASAINLRRR
jgi:hypothetical protein